jgi:hypothetical protein
MTDDSRYYEPLSEIKQAVDKLSAQIHSISSSKPLVDPTANVLSLVSAETKRADDLRMAESRRIDDVMKLRAEYSEKLSNAEAKRIDAIRAVDVGAVAIASDRASQQAAVLANQVVQSAETLRALVATTAGQVATNQQTTANQLNERISALERSQYEKTGLAGVPQQLLDRIDQMETILSETRGRTGVDDKMKAIIGVIVGSAVTYLLIEFMKGT